MRPRLRLRLSAATALVVALALVLTACGSGGSGRRGHRSGGSSGGYGDGGSSVSKDDDDDYDIDDDLDDLPTDDYDYDYDDSTDDPAPTDPSSVALSSILPDLPALSGTVFTVGGETDGEAGLCEDYAEVCADATDRAQTGFMNDAQDEYASFQVLAYASEADAADALAIGLDALAAEEGNTERERDALGDGSIAFHSSQGGDEALVTVIQRGPYLGAVAHGADDETRLGSWDLADAMSAMFDERMVQAEAGQEPTATVDA